MKSNKKFNKRLLGRDPSCGRVAFKTGVTLNERDRLRNRNTKVARKNLRRLLNGDE